MSLAKQVLTFVAESGTTGRTDTDIEQKIDRRLAVAATSRMLLAGNGYIKANGATRTTTNGTQHPVWVATDAGRDHLAEELLNA